MKIHIRGGGAGGITFALIGFAATVGVAILLGIPGIFGVSFGWDWPGIDVGRTSFHALTPKIETVRSADIFLDRGEELLARYELELESGRARASVYTWGWVPAVGKLEIVHQNPVIEGTASQDVQMVAADRGFYAIDASIVDAVGTFRITWRVERATRFGQAIRLIRSGLSYLPFLILAALMIAGLGVFLTRMRWT